MTTGAEDLARSTSRVALTPLTTADSAKLFGWINDCEQVVSNSPYKPIHEGNHERWFADIQSRLDVVIFGIRDSLSEDLLGSAQILNISRFIGPARSRSELASGKRRIAAWAPRL